MTYFYIGCRVDEIQTLVPSKSETYPTAVYYRSGETINLTGKWEANTRAIESILNANREEEHQRQLALALATDLHTTGILSRFARSGRKMLRRDELAAIQAIYGVGKR